MSDGAEMRAAGLNGQVELDRDQVRILRERFRDRFLFGNRGVKSIYVGDITSIQFKPPGTFTNGFIQFAYPGSIESKQGLADAVQDENSVFFNDSQTPAFETLCRAIERRRSELRRPAGSMLLFDVELRAIPDTAAKIRAIQLLIDRAGMDITSARQELDRPLPAALILGIPSDVADEWADALREAGCDAATVASSTVAPSPQPAPPADIPSQLERLAALRDSGVLTQAEFEVAKQRALTSK